MPIVKTQFPASLSLADLTPRTGFAIYGVSSDDLSGTSVSFAGDVNADGINDFIIGAPGANSFVGVSYVLFGAKDIGNSGVLALPSLNGTNGFVITGISPGDKSGASVSAAGDVNADGIADLIIGAYVVNSAAGASYVVFGAKGIGNKGVLALSSLNGSNGFAITGVHSGDGSGYSVSAAGDVNADGIADLIIGAPGVNSSAGASYVVFGAKNIGNTGVLALSALNGTNGFAIIGVNSNDVSGTSVSAAGDVNADGIADLIIGAPTAGNRMGITYVVFGSKEVGSLNGLSFANLNGKNGFQIIGGIHISGSGYFVSGAGDVNDDGVSDLLIGTPQQGGLYGSTEASYVVFGGKGIGSSGRFFLADLNGTNGFNVTAANMNDLNNGFSVGKAGDINADGVDDLIIGGFGANKQAGASYVIFGQKNIGSLT